jgi:hypothetical protein
MRDAQRLRVTQLHAALHIALAVTLATTTYLVVSRVAGWTTLAVGVLCLSTYLRRARQLR